MQKRLNLAVQRQTFRQWEAVCLSSSIQVFPLDVTTPRDSYARNYRELVTLLALCKCLAETIFETLTIGSVRENLTTRSYPDKVLAH